MPQRTRREVSDVEYRRKLEQQEHDRYHRKLEQRIAKLEERVRQIEESLRG